MPSKFRALLEKVPLKLIAVLLFAILIPSLLVTGLGLVAVFQADSFVQDRFRRPLVDKVGMLVSQLDEDWSNRLRIYSDYLREAVRRPAHLGDLAKRDPCVKAVFLEVPEGLQRAPEPPPLELWTADPAPELREISTLENVDRNLPEALAACRKALVGDLDDANLVEALLAAARISYRLGDKEASRGYLRSALERFGNTVDSSGILREVPILWRTFEVERELGLEGPARETAGRLDAALERGSRWMDPAVLQFFQGRLASLGEPYRPSAPLPRASSAPSLTEEALAELSRLLPGGDGSAPGRPWVETHLSLASTGPLDFVSFRPGGGGSWVHLLLDREKLLEEARLQGRVVGLSEDGLRFGAAGGAGSALGSPEAILPAPLGTLRVEYLPGPGELPEGFRGFNVLSLATFTWAVIILVLTILAGSLFTLNSVVREMRTARMKSDFVSFVSHELKTPLTAIRTLTETILSGRTENEEENRFCLQMIDRESQRLSKLIEQILEYSRIERKQKEFRFESCDMESVVREAVRIFQEHNRGDPREIEVNAVQHISKIRMDRAAMIELFLNLLSNAAKYSPGDRKVVVNLRESIDDISVEVVDQGVGIRKRDQRRIFDQFYRADDLLTREVEGTGLGLTFARYIAKVHNGEIKVTSQLNAGSTFTLQVRKTEVIAG